MTLKRRSHYGVRVRQFLLTAALATPIAFAIGTTPPFSVDTRAQGVAGMFGPLVPARVGSERVGPTRSGNNITIPSSWSCGSTTNNVFALSNQQDGVFRTVGRTISGKVQTLTTGPLVNGSPASVQLRETRGGFSNLTDVAMTDQNRDGVFDGLALSGVVNGTTSFVFDQGGAFISIPWSQASALGIKTSGTCAGNVPQIWIPLADTNGDGRGDAVVFDLDGDGRADSDLVRGAILLAPTVPAMGPVGRLILVLALGLIGTWFLSRRRNHDSGTTAAV